MPGLQPQNLNELSGFVIDRSKDILSTTEVGNTPSIGQRASEVNLFANTEGEDPALTEIKQVARSLESNLSTLKKLEEVQEELLNMAKIDARAAVASRPSTDICVSSMSYAFCRSLSGSFKDTGDMAELTYDDF